MGFMKPILYVYPARHTVSFSIVARKHIEYIKRMNIANVYEMDELDLPSFVPSIRYYAVLHPFLFIWERVVNRISNATPQRLKHKVSQYVENFKNQFDQVIAIDVCDSDRISEYAVNLLNYADKIIVPSSFCVEVYRSSGVRKPVYRVPHGVDAEWYTTPNIWGTELRVKVGSLVKAVYEYKVRKSKKILLFWLWHSPERKGLDEVIKVYTRLRRERSDVALIMKVASFPSFLAAHLSPDYPSKPEELDISFVVGWISDFDKMALYDLADITLMFSVGGGFEINCLESLARGVPCIASYWGSWRDYLPPFLGVKTGERVKVFDKHDIHVGYGYKVDVEDALNKIHDILENYDEYKAKTEEWRQKVLFNEFRWDIIAQKLVNVVMS
jgi:glycosyltransferase involved in cell wall biosynthesis